MAMTIDEAIVHAREVAENRDDICAECRAEHQQLAEWLEELKAIKNGFTDDLLNMGYTKGYRNAIDEFVEMTKKANIDNYNYPSSCISTIEKLLKAGGENDG